LRRKPITATIANALKAITIPGPVTVGCTRRPGATLDGAIVATVSITFDVVVVELNVTLEGDTLHELSDGNPVHCGVNVNVPASPFIAVSISDVLPDCPGWVRLAEKSGDTTTLVGWGWEPHWSLFVRSENLRGVVYIKLRD
jgi:hypothetical protein